MDATLFQEWRYPEAVSERQPTMSSALGKRPAQAACSHSSPSRSTRAERAVVDGASDSEESEREESEGGESEGEVAAGHSPEKPMQVDMEDE